MGWRVGLPVDAPAPSAPRSDSIDITATNIAQRFGLAGKGDIAPGFDADLWIADLSHHDLVRREDLFYRNQFSAHEGQRIRGRTVRTLVRGEDPGRGRFIRGGARS